MTLETMSVVVAELNKRGIDATLEYPGWIRMTLPNGNSLNGGDVNETFDIDLCDASTCDVIETIGSTIPSDCTDVQRIADHCACTYSEGVETNAKEGR